jgi:GTP cyclohydrolase I
MSENPEQFFRFAEGKRAVEALLRALGENPEREGLKDTPARVMLMLQELLHQEEFEFTTFDGEGSSEMIVQTNIPLQSLCEHHMLPFMGTAAVAYIPNGRIVGLSKLTRSVYYCSRGLQNQERITNAIANMIDDELRPKGVGVIIKARHMCMELRGVHAPNVYTLTSALRGDFLEKPSTKAEFLELARMP